MRVVEVVNHGSFFREPRGLGVTVWVCHPCTRLKFGRWRGSQMGRAQPRIVVSRKPPGIRRRDLRPAQPMARMVCARRRAFPVVCGTSTRSSKATVLMLVTLRGRGGSSTRFHGSEHCV